MTAVRIMLGIALTLAVVAVAGAAASYFANRPHSYSHQLASLNREQVVLRARLSAAETQIASLKASSQAGAVQSLQGRVNGMNNTVSQLTICLPQMEQQINSENIQTSNSGGFLTSAFIQDPAIISTNCTKVLNGH